MLWVKKGATILYWLLFHQMLTDFQYSFATDLAVGVTSHLERVTNFNFGATPVFSRLLQALYHLF